MSIFNTSSAGANQDDLWKQMESTGNWNPQAAVDTLTPYTESSYQRENSRTGKMETVYRNNAYARKQAVKELNARYTSVRDKDRSRVGATLQLGSADTSAQMLRPQSEADVSIAEPDTGAASRPDFGGGADSGRNPMANQSGDAGTAGLNVDDKLQGRRRSTGGIRI